MSTKLARPSPPGFACANQIANLASDANASRSKNNACVLGAFGQYGHFGLQIPNHLEKKSGRQRGIASSDLDRPEWCIGIYTAHVYHPSGKGGWNRGSGGGMHQWVIQTTRLSNSLFKELFDLLDLIHGTLSAILGDVKDLRDEA
jgi:hypothetical protein